MRQALMMVMLIAVSATTLASGRSNDKISQSEDWLESLNRSVFFQIGLPAAELSRLKLEFKKSVSEMAVDDDYADWASNDALWQLKEKAAVGSLLASQYFVFADRNPEKQLIMVGYYSPTSDKIEIIGWDKCSTGDPAHGNDYHFTPAGIFANTLECFSFRAAGTKNSNGWRGYGRKNCRVWDFGYQSTTKPIRGKEQWREIRLLMHATDPDGGEPKLGSPQSKGCVRISEKFNRFLDYYGIIDAEYESNLFRKSVIWLLLKDRHPVSGAGRYLIVGDSAAE